MTDVTFINPSLPFHPLGRRRLVFHAHLKDLSTRIVGARYRAKCLPGSRDPFKRDTAHLGNLSIQGFYSVEVWHCLLLHSEPQALFDYFPYTQKKGCHWLSNRSHDLTLNGRVSDHKAISSKRVSFILITARICENNCFKMFTNLQKVIPQVKGNLIIAVFISKTYKSDHFILDTRQFRELIWNVLLSHITRTLFLTSSATTKFQVTLVGLYLRAGNKKRYNYNEYKQLVSYVM